MTGSLKLAAILAADVVGYSRLVGADEDRTLTRLRALRTDLIDPAITAHGGRVVKRTGDGLIVEFRSIVDSVRCAMKSLNGMIEHNAGLPPDQRIEFRVGIHLGDVVQESDGDLMGDGGNIASRRHSQPRFDLSFGRRVPAGAGAARRRCQRRRREAVKKNVETMRVYCVEVGNPAAPAKFGWVLHRPFLPALAVLARTLYLHRLGTPFSPVG
jgi:hypothetical protein